MCITNRMEIQNLSKRLGEVRQLAKLSQTALARQLGVSPSLISLWESGERLPSQEQLLEVAGAAGVSLDYLLNAETLPHFKFRGKATLPSPRKVACDTVMRDAAQQVHGLHSAYKLAGQAPKPFGLKMQFVSGALPDVAAQVRDYFRLNRRVTLPELKQALVEQNIHVFEWDMPSEISGLSYRGTLTTIIVNRRHPVARRLFTLAHELAHVLFHLGNGESVVVSEIASNRDPLEKQANQFAAELLMPTKDLDQLERDHRGQLERPSFLPVAANVFNVSPDAMFYRLAERKILAWPDKNRFLRNIEPSQDIPPFRVTNIAEQVDPEFLGLGLRLYTSEAVSSGKLAEWFFTSRLKLEEYFGGLDRAEFEMESENGD